MVELFHTVCSTTTALLQKAGVPAEKIVVIPESIDLNIFKNYSLEEKNKIKQKLTLPQDKVIIGSFQKDGSGWGEGLKPKLEKGPDIFCDVVEKIAAEMPIHILLTGPARGYVKHRLDRAGIPYTHHFLQNFREIVEYYNALDLYLVTSRQEGGPKAILESMACGIPFVTTEVGMAPDIVKDRVNGRIVEVEDTLALTDAAIQIIHNVDDAQTMIEHGLRDVKSFATSVIIDRYMKELYSNVGFSKT
jgi:glycosyltransferase involved in cell wall biosynthesis